MRELTGKEERALMFLGLAWNAFVELPRSDDDTHDFRQAIHAAQRIILSRPATERVDERQLAESQAEG